ncbi:hypothetical protein NY537_10450 [Curtobacterium flaccumfaciens pv. betae]|uniref:hypothetical protein n=1 Tax=Curtobacterium flaccumfaciens TaxID=2035 RepID=UPI0026599009|nr:hypothetical protein [Curtobacterium flaccumfaciens]MCS5513161.1 hypothetical protein [Curtobacterium flaccumfaciens pv. betae]
MSASTTLSRPNTAAHTAVGNDGLTVDERIDLAAAHRAGAGSPVLTPVERDAIRQWRKTRGER